VTAHQFQQSVVLYIPAKGRSTGIPRKNLVKLLDKPLLAYSLNEALLVAASPRNVVVSSEDDEIGRLATSCGATHIQRKPELSQDKVRVREVLAAELDALEALGGRDAILVVLLPTSPLRRASHIRDAMDAFMREPTAFSLVSVTASPAAPAHQLGLTADRKLTFPHGIEAVNHNSQRQTIAPSFYPNGAIYIVRLREFRNFPFFFHPTRTIGFLLDGASAIDIDSPEQLEFAASALTSRRTQQHCK
jgi:CMP-N,N'-diacetyllegionaminic acid synthase